MKLIASIILSFLITNLWAQQSPCPNPKLPGIVGGIILTADELNCMATRAEYKCEQLEKDLESSEINKVIQCNKKSLSENTVGNMNLPDCIWNGIKLSGETLADISKIPGKLAESIAKGFSETQACNKSVDKKREILNAFNKSIPDPRYQLEERFLGNYLEDAPCSEIEKLLSARYQGYQQQVYRNRINAINAGKKVDPIESKEGADLSKMLAEAIKSMGQSYNCYTPKVKAEMLCVGVTTLLVDAAIGGGVFMAAKKMTAIVKSKRALGRIEDAINDGRPIDLSDSSKLLAGDRLKAGRELLGLKRPLMDSEKRAILEAHEVGIKEGRGFYTYNDQDIIQKTRKLRREGGFSEEQTRKLMEAGITGMMDDPFFRKAMIGHFKKYMTVTMTAAQENALAAVHNLGHSFEVGFADKASKLLKESGFSDEQIKRILQIKSNQEKKIAEVVSSTLVEAPKPAANVSLSQPASKPAALAVPSKPAAPVVPDFKPDPVKLQKVRADIDSQYAKDKLHTSVLDAMPLEQTPEDLQKFSQIVGKKSPREVETVINFTRPVKPEDVAAFLKNPKGIPPESIKKLKMVFPNLTPDNIEEVIALGQKRTKEELVAFKDYRRKNAETSLLAIFGRGDMKIAETIEQSSLRIREHVNQVESWEAKLKDPKAPSYNRQSYADQAERAKRTIEIEKAKCKKILDLYIAAYNMPDYTKQYQAAYDKQCAGF